MRRVRQEAGSLRGKREHADGQGAQRQSELLRLLAGYAAGHPCEDIAPFRRFVERQPRCFERDCFDDGHVTASAVVLNHAGSHMLLTHHAKLGRWLQLGGHADGDADALRVACREAREESGLAVVPVCAEPVDIDIHRIPPRGVEPAHLHYDVRFLLRVVDGSARFVLSDESLALRWVRLDEVAAITSEVSMLRLAAKAQAAIAGESPAR